MTSARLGPSARLPPEPAARGVPSAAAAAAVVARLPLAPVLLAGEPHELGVDVDRAARVAVLGARTGRSSRPPTITCCHSGTGRCSSTITSVSPRTVSSQSPNSSALLTVADSETSRTDSGRWMITSSQTAPRNRSAR